MAKTQTTSTPNETITSKTFTLGAPVSAKLSRRYKLAAMANDSTVAALVANVLQSHADSVGFIDPQDIATK